MAPCSSRAERDDELATFFAAILLTARVISDGPIIWLGSIAIITCWLESECRMSVAASTPALYVAAPCAHSSEIRRPGQAAGPACEIA